MSARSSGKSPSTPSAPHPESQPLFPGRAVVQSRARPDRGLAYHPIVVGDQVVVCDEKRLIAYQLDARLAGPPESTAPAEIPLAWEQPLSSTFSGRRTGRPVQATPRYTVTAHGDRIYARIGPPQSRMGSSYLIAVRNSGEIEGKLLWKRAPTDLRLPEREGDAGPRMGMAFEGTPVASDRSVYVALTDAGTMTSALVACLDAETGDLRWSRYVGSATSNMDMMGTNMGLEVGNRLLSVDGSTVYYQTNLGAIAALDAETGEIRWLITYSAKGAAGPPIRRDLNPAIIHNGLVIAAPDDTAEIFGIDAETGHIVWTTNPLPEITHVLGVCQGRLIATGTRVWSIDIETGKVLDYWPQGGAGMDGYGRGLLAGGAVYWPTRTQIHILDPSAPGLRPQHEPIELEQAFGTTGGNLAVGDGYLVVAQEDALVVFCQNRRLIDRFKQLIVQEPDRADHYVRLARMADAAGQDDLALESLESALAKARPDDLFDGEPLREVAATQQYRLRSRLGLAALQAHDASTAARQFEEAARLARTDRDALVAQLRLAEALEQADRPARAVEVLQNLITDERMARLRTLADPARTVRADLLIAERLEALLDRHGRSLYRPYDIKARALLTRGLAASDPHLLDQISQSYPAAEVIPEVLAAQARIAEKSDRPELAARAYRQLLAQADDDPARAAALLGLANAYENREFYELAHKTYAQALARYATIHPPGSDQDATVGSLVSERSSLPPFDQLGPDRLPADLPLPLERVWSTRWESPRRPILAVGSLPSTQLARIFLVENQTLRPVHPASGETPWSADLGADTTWIAYLADHVIAAAPDRLTGLDPATGAVRWRHLVNPDTPPHPRLDPFAGPPAKKKDEAEDPAPPLHGFQIVGDRIIALSGSAELLCFDPDSGLVNWSYRPTQGSIHEAFLAEPHRIVLQLRSPNAIVQLDPRNGRGLGQLPQSEDVQPWVRPPVPLDEDRLAVVADDRTIIALELDRGSVVWTYREPSALPRGGPPRLIGDAACLLALRDGGELVRLDPATGRKLWSRLLGVEDLTDWPAAITLDDRHVYSACGPDPTLTAYDLADGAVAWRRNLTGPSSGWVLDLTPRCVVVHPSPARAADTTLPDLPLIVCARDDGRIVQRMVLPAEVTDLAVRVDGAGILVATQSGGWGLGLQPPMDDIPSTR